MNTSIEFDFASNLLLRTRQHSVPKAREDQADSNIEGRPTTVGGVATGDESNSGSFERAQSLYAKGPTN
jgi:hypothetical protein